MYISWHTFRILVVYKMLLFNCLLFKTRENLRIASVHYQVVISGIDQWRKDLQCKIQAGYIYGTSLVLQGAICPR